MITDKIEQGSSKGNVQRQSHVSGFCEGEEPRWFRVDDTTIL